MTVPVFICCRDRVHDLRLLVEWLERAGFDRITFIDNASTYGPLLEFYDTTPHEVAFLDYNAGSRAIWSAGLVPDEPFVYTDPDVLPIDECPLDVVEYFSAAMQKYHAPKIGFGIKTDDVLDLDPKSLKVETGWQSPARMVDAHFANAPIDTTFALYRAGRDFTFDGLRSTFPYLIRHLPWYRDVNDLDEESRYYLENAEDGETASRWAGVYREVQR